MATTFPNYPATTLEEAVTLTITASNQLHEVINGDENTQIQVEDGSYIPSLRKAMKEGSSYVGFGGQYKNLVVTVSGTGYQGTITAERLVVEDSSYACSVLRAVSVSFNGTNSGANGLDTGSMTDGNWYYMYVIYNGTTVASLISLSSTVPTLPSGYTKYILVGSGYVPSATTAFLLSTKKGNVTTYITDGAAGFVPLVAGGLSSTVKAVSLATAMPPEALSVGIRIQHSGAGGTNVLLTTGVASYITALPGGNTVVTDIDLPIPRTIYYTASEGAAYISVVRYTTPY